MWNDGAVGADARKAGQGMILPTDTRKTALLLIALASLVAGLMVSWSGWARAAQVTWLIGVMPVLASLVIEIIGSLRRGEVGLDIVAALSMSAAALFGETLAAAVVALMYAGGTLLESFAEGRARGAMHALLARVPHSATRCRADGLEEVPLEKIAPDDRLLIRRGELVPVDGRVIAGLAVLDMSSLTGESLPVRVAAGDEVMSGTTNAGEAFELLVLRPASDSTYAGIVRVVEAAQRSKAPLSRLADRWSLGFLAVTLAIASTAWWATGDAIRAVAVLVVATPCPLILAVPVALVAGMSRAARSGILVKGAAALEAMAEIRTLIVDKTGTLTDGRPAITGFIGQPGIDEPTVLRLAAALDQASKHPVAQAIVAAATALGMTLPQPTDVAEVPGEGVTGVVEGRRVAVGGHGFVVRLIDAPAVFPDAVIAGTMLVAVAIDDRLAGHIVMEDPLRADAEELLGRLRTQGIERVLLATGDRRDVAERIAGALGLEGIHAGLTPEGKLALVESERARGSVMMVGDGVNDAPALSAATVGVAMGARGAAASAEAADVVLLVDKIERLEAGIHIARAARTIALQSVAVGIGLSVAGMIAASFGYLAPVEGAILQEAIDVAVILNALRALRI